MKNIKKSYGMACCSYNDKNEPRILLVKKNISYGLAEMFYTSNYRPRDIQKLRYYFERMTNQEKIWIANRQFEIIYSLVRGSVDRRDNEYMVAKLKFNSLFAPNPRFILDLLDSTGSVSEIWEIPKGRGNNKETNLETAIREFKEETGISIKKYIVLPPSGIFTEEIETPRQFYHHEYFISYMAKPIIPRVKISNYNQTREINEIQWFTLRELSVLDKKNQRVYQLAKKILNSFKKRIRKGKIFPMTFPEISSARKYSD